MDEMSEVSVEEFDYRDSDFLELIYPPAKEEEIRKLLGCFELEVNYGEEFSDDIAIKVKNPYGGSDLTVWLEDQFAIGFKGFSGWFDANEEGYVEFLSVLFALLTNRVGALLVVKEPQSFVELWKGDMPTKAEQIGIKELPAEGAFLSLQYFDPRFDQLSKHLME